MTDHEDLLRLAEKATPGPWRRCEACDERDAGCGLIWDVPLDVCVATTNADEVADRELNEKLRMANARYIAACHPTRIRALVEEVRDLRRALAEATQPNPVWDKVEALAQKVVDLEDE